MVLDRSVFLLLKLFRVPPHPKQEKTTKFKLAKIKILQKTYYFGTCIIVRLANIVPSGVVPSIVTRWQ
jgi:hypothetical protein